MEKSAEPSESPPQKSRKERWEETHAHAPRTTGLKVLDVFIYPVLTNFSVFAISVVATYLTSKGGQRNPEGKLVYGKIGEWFHQRGTWLANKFKATGMSDAQADMSKMVAFSFIDGSLMSVPVKLLEDRREEIGRAIDEKLGTKPDDESVYAAEPKQTWLSVLGGRFLTASIVVPTAVALDKTGLNDRLFNKPGLQAGEWLAKQPAMAGIAKKLDVKELSRVGFFEAFYTSVCTAGLYISSRCIARATEKKEPPVITAPAASEPADTETTPRHADESLKKPTAAKPPAGFTDRYQSESASTSMGMSV